MSDLDLQIKKVSNGYIIYARRCSGEYPFLAAVCQDDSQLRDYLFANITDLLDGSPEQQS